MTGSRTATAAIMGTMMSIAAPDGTSAEPFATATRTAFAWLRHADELFSPFKADSAVSRIRDGRLPPGIHRSCRRRRRTRFLVVEDQATGHSPSTLLGRGLGWITDPPHIRGPG
jgi:hypothetical protein